MPLTTEGRHMLSQMKKKHGDKAGEDMFYKSMREKVAGSDKWHKKMKSGSKKYSREAVMMAANMKG